MKKAMFFVIVLSLVTMLPVYCIKAMQCSVAAPQSSTNVISLLLASLFGGSETVSQIQTHAAIRPSFLTPEQEFYHHVRQKDYDALGQSSYKPPLDQFRALVDTDDSRLVNALTRNKNNQYLCQALLVAAKRQNAENIRLLTFMIDCAPDNSYVYNLIRAAFLDASRHSTPPILEQFLNYYVLANWRDDARQYIQKSGTTPLHAAINMANYPNVLFLLAHGAPLNCTGPREPENEHKKAKRMAADYESKNATKIAQQLRKIAISVYYCMHPEELFKLVAKLKEGTEHEKEHLRKRIYLILKICPVFMTQPIVDDNGDTLLHKAASLKDANMCVYCLSFGVNLLLLKNKQGLTPYDLVIKQCAYAHGDMAQSVEVRNARILLKALINYRDKVHTFTSCSDFVNWIVKQEQ